MIVNDRYLIKTVHCGTDNIALWEVKNKIYRRLNTTLHYGIPERINQVCLPLGADLFVPGRQICRKRCWMWRNSFKLTIKE